MKARREDAATVLADVVTSGDVARRLGLKSNVPAN